MAQKIHCADHIPAFTLQNQSSLPWLRACSGFGFELQMAKIHSNFVTKMLM
jgi:hypothetical protein